MAVRVRPLTLTHKVFEVMPLDIVGEIADVDATVLLRVGADVRHHLFFVGCPFLVAPSGSSTSSTV